MGRAVTVVLLFLFLSPRLIAHQTPAAPAELLTLEQAVTTALQNNRLIRISALEVEKLDENISASRTHRLPIFQASVLASTLLTPLSFEYKQGVFGTYDNVGPIPKQDTQITTPRRLNAYFLNSISQPLSQLYKINLGLREQELARDVSREEVRAKRQSVRNQVTRVYYDLVQTQSALDASKQAVEFYTELDRVTGQYLMKQVVLKSDSIEVKMRLAREQLEMVKLRNDLENQQERINQLLGRDVRQRFRVEDTPAPALVEFDATVAQGHALEQRPEMRQARLKLKQAEYDRRQKKAEYIPDVSLSFQHLSFANMEMLPKNVLTAGISLTWEPFDWGRKSHELAAKSKTIQQAASSLQETETQVLLDVNTQFRKVQETGASLRVMRLAMEAAKEKLRVTEEGYRLQTVRLDQVLESQTGVSSAAFQYQRALSNYWSARADLTKATGEE
jgi:outer membrane protein TolC